jgi:hypothetical protein
MWWSRDPAQCAPAARAPRILRDARAAECELSGEQRMEQLRQVAMYALLSILIDQVLLMGLV